MPGIRSITAGVFAAFSLVCAAGAASKYVFSKDVHETARVMDWYPLQVGNRWIYEHETKYGDAFRPNIEQWTREVTVTGHVKIPEGLIVLRSAKLLSGSKNAPNQQPHPFLIRGQYIYRAFFDPVKKTLDARNKDNIETGKETPEFFFPMQVGLLWAEKNREESDAEARAKNLSQDLYMHWVVTGRGPHGTMTPGPISPAAYSLSYATQAGPMERWFEKGVGVIAEATKSSGGGYLESRMLLKKFIPGSGAKSK